MTLYGALRETDKLADTLPHLDILEIQRELIEAHRNNGYLNQVLEGKNTFVNILTELYNKKHKGWRFWLPIKKDEEYNKEIKELDEILRTEFETTFLSELIKPASSLVLASALFPPVNVGLDIIKYRGCMEIEHYILSGTMVGLVMGLLSTAFQIESKYNQFFQNEAEYLDNKLQELDLIKPKVNWWVK